MINITYIHHSGFAVETDKNVLIFDYYTENGKIEPINLDDFNGKDIFFFVSHSHADHFDKAIFDFKGKNIYYIISDDVKLNNVDNETTLIVKPHEKYNFKNLKIETLLSNDMGVAFLVEVDEKTIYHSGDLNWWHWNGEPYEWNKSMGIAYKNEIELIKNRNIDVAFVPVDPRLEENYILAIDYIMKNTNIKYVLPMHFWGDFSVYDKVCSDEKSENYRDKLVKINHTNEKFNLK